MSVCFPHLRKYDGDLLSHASVNFPAPSPSAHVGNILSHPLLGPCREPVSGFSWKCSAMLEPVFRHGRQSLTPTGMLHASGAATGRTGYAYGDM